MKDADRSSNIKAGFFVLVALIVLIVGSLWVAGSTLFGARRVSYRVAMTDSGGLAPGDRVRIAGVSVGRIQALELNTGADRPVELEIGIRPAYAIHADGSARVATTGLMGKAYLDVDAGTPDAPRLAEGDEIPGVRSPGFEDALSELAEISSSAQGILEQAATVVEAVSREVGPVLENLNAMMSEDNAENLNRLLANLRAASDDFGPRLDTLLARLDSIAQGLEQGTEGLPELTTRASALVEDLQTALGPDGSRLTAMLDAAEASLAEAGDAMSVVGNNRDELAATLSDLRDTIANLKAFSQHVKERPFSLVRIRTEPDRQPGQGVAEKR